MAVLVYFFHAAIVLVCVYGMLSGFPWELALPFTCASSFITLATWRAEITWLRVCGSCFAAVYSLGLPAFAVMFVSTFYGHAYDDLSPNLLFWLGVSGALALLQLRRSSSRYPRLN